MQSVMSFLIKPCRPVAQLGLTDKVKLINPGSVSAEHDSSVWRTVEEFFEEQETDLMFCTKFSLCFLWDQVPFTLSNSVWLLYLCLLHARHGLLACSIDECMMDPMLFPNNSTVLPTPPCLLTLLGAMVEFTYRTRRIHVPLICLLSPISGPY